MAAFCATGRQLSIAFEFGSAVAADWTEFALPRSEMLEFGRRTFETWLSGDVATLPRVQEFET
jgi:hypothetical protein